MTHRAAADRYETMHYRHAGRSGLKLPAISLGLWQNFGGTRDYPSAFEILGAAFDAGITHFDLANNYGPPPGAAEELFGQVLARDFRPYRDELIVSSKAGYNMWEGPYGEWGSRKNLIASADQSLKRLGLNYVDVFYSHRFDPRTPLEETMGALATLVAQGKTLYVGISNYPVEQTRQAHAILAGLGVPCVLHQPSYSMLNRWIENDGTIDACGELGIGMIAFSPLAQGILSGKYNTGDTQGARGTSNNPFLKAANIKPETLTAIDALAAIARARGQTLPQLALAWVLRRPEMTSALIGVRTLAQLQDNLGALDNLAFTQDERDAIAQCTAPGMMDGKPRW
ncbi:aldo/keto reductase [uncultured Devosia sp.]|uniref:aldo/keto reductase n=1 Tax=uncultured Devosia sp. TaxID=211434 RepID=UPI0035C9F991